MASENVKKSGIPLNSPIEKPSFGQVVSVLTLSSALIFLWAIIIRENIVESPFEIEALLDLDWFAPYLLGFALQEAILPVALLFLFSRSQLFNQLLESGSSSQTIWKSTLVFMLLQALVFQYRFALLSRTEDQVTIGILMVLAAGLFGGWRAGLNVGIFTSLSIGTLNSIVWIEPPDTFDLSGVFENVVFDMVALSPTWVGLSLGLISERAGRMRLRPIFMISSTALLVLFSFILILISTNDPGELAERVLPSLAITALAMLALTYMVRGVENESIRRESEATQLQLAQTQLALSKAELRALHAQINPHFFFNTLNTIRYFVRTDPDMARELLIKLSDIFQRVLQAKEFVSLKEELEFVRTYLDLEKARLEERLQIDWPKVQKAYLEIKVPTLILQPLVENAVLHGIGSKEEGGNIRISVNRQKKDLLITVEDDGPGFSYSSGEKGKEGSPRASIGLNNIDDRLQLLFGEEFRLAIDSEPNQGSRVTIRIPLEGNK
jgi:LytS/YehU family sensor histidine kinase